MKGQGNYASNECFKMVLNFKHGQVWREGEKESTAIEKIGERWYKNEPRHSDEVRLYNSQ